MNLDFEGRGEFDFRRFGILLKNLKYVFRTLCMKYTHNGEVVYVYLSPFLCQSVRIFHLRNYLTYLDEIQYRGSTLKVVGRN